MKIKISTMTKNSVLDIYSIRNQIDSSPRYQRNGDLWDHYKKQLFIDSIITGFDVPKFYFHVLSKPRKDNSTRYAIIDGKQRLEAIWGFIDNKFSLASLQHPHDNFNLTGMYYRDLTFNFPKLAGRFDQYCLPIMLVTANINVIEEMFLRLNESVSFTAAEKRNAMGGKLTNIIKNLITEPFFVKFIKINNKRFQHHEICVRLLFIEYGICNLGIIDTKRSYLDEFVRRFLVDDIDPNIPNTVKNTIHQMDKIFKFRDSLLNSNGAIIVYYLLVREAILQKQLHKITREKIKKFVNAVKKNKVDRIDNLQKEKIYLSEYDRLTIQGSTVASSLKTRFMIIAEYFGIDSSNIYRPQPKLYDYYAKS